jgi:RNA polymerase sigma-70 factor (ECF subfamily)
MTTTGVNSALQRARARLAEMSVEQHVPNEPDEQQRATVDAYVAAFDAADVDGLARLLHRDVVLEMPPMWNWYRGVDAYRGFMVRVYRTRGTTWRSMPVTANGQPAIVAFRGDADGSFTLHTVQVFTVRDGLIARTAVFQDPVVLEHFAIELDGSR